jgi:hypothetical protein
MDAHADRRLAKTNRWLVILAIVAVVVLLAIMLVVLLVLTGIIAEPETLLETIVRALSGG